MSSFLNHGAHQFMPCQEGRSSLNDYSTGLGSPLASNQPRSDESSLQCVQDQQVGDGEFQADRSKCSILEDLDFFHCTLATDFELTWRLLQDIDGDVANALATTQQEFQAMIGQAHCAARASASVARQMIECVPAYSKRVRKNTKQQYSAIQFLGQAQAWLKMIKQNAAKVRATYVKLLDSVRYIMQCTTLLVDFTCMEEVGETGHFQKTSSDLALVLYHLERIEYVLSDCSDFWIALHSAELAASQLEKNAAWWAEEVVAKDLRSHTNPSYLEFCGALQSFCQYCVSISPPC